MPLRSMTYPVVPALQADAVLSQANPVSGTNYTVLATSSNIRVITIAANTTWTVQPTPLDLTFTIDGLTQIFRKGNPASATNYVAQFVSPAAAIQSDMGSTIVHEPLLEGRSVKIEASVTGGTVQALASRLKYGKW